MVDNFHSDGATHRFLGAAAGFLDAAPLGGFGLPSKSAWAETVDLPAKGGPASGPSAMPQSLPLLQNSGFRT
jgi:hypothetical protein